MFILGTNDCFLKVVAIDQVESILSWQLGDCKIKKPKKEARGPASFVLRIAMNTLLLLSIEEILWNCFRGTLSFFM